MQCLVIPNGPDRAAGPFNQPAIMAKHIGNSGSPRCAAMVCRDQREKVNTDTDKERGSDDEDD